MEELTSLGAVEIEKGNFQELNYVVNFESYFGKQVCDLKSYMPQIEFAYNQSKHQSIGKSPFEVVYGLQPIGLIDFSPQTTSK